MHDILGQLQLGHVLLIVHHPSHFRRVETVLVDQDAAGPDACRDGIGAHANFLAFEVFRLLDAGIGAHEQSCVVKAS